MRRLALLLACALLASAASWWLPGTAAATSYLVTTTRDETDPNPTDDLCQIPSSVQCSLRAAVQTTNAHPGPDTILLPGGSILKSLVYLLTGQSGEDTALSGDLDITDALTVTVSGGKSRMFGGSPIIDGGGIDRVFDVKDGGSLALTGITVRNGAVGVANHGGGILANGDLVLSNDTIAGNKAGFSGGVEAHKGLVVANTSFSNNSAAFTEGAILITGTASLTRVRVSGNKAGAGGTSVGGIRNAPGATTTIADSTFDHNTPHAIQNVGSLTLTRSTIATNTVPANQTGRGGGLWNIGTLTVSNSTIVGNSAAVAGGGLYSESGSTTLVNDTFAGNGAPAGGNVFTAGAKIEAVNTIFAGATSGGNCAGPLTSQGHNLDDGITCALTGTGDLTNQNPQLAPLADNGGPTQTMALLPGSPAIDAGGSGCPAKDQRGVQRPAGNACDIGAYEFAISADLAVTLAATPAQLKLGEPITYTATVTNKGPNPATGVSLANALPAGATLVSAKASSGSCTTTGAIVCSLGTLADQAKATVTVVATATKAGTLSDSVSVKALQIDPDATTNSARADVLVSAPQTQVAGASGFRARVASIRGRRVKGRARVRVVLILSKPLTAKARLLFRRRGLAATTTTLKGGRRALTLRARRRSGRGRYIVRIVLSDTQQHRRVLTLGVLLR
jgi:uncharacterized repeat protein (TIGR01451 family)/CSLREA domain-containing protein